MSANLYLIAKCSGLNILQKWKSTSTIIFFSKIIVHIIPVVEMGHLKYHFLYDSLIQISYITMRCINVNNLQILNWCR